MKGEEISIHFQSTLKVQKERTLCCEGVASYILYFQGLIKMGARSQVMSGIGLLCLVSSVWFSPSFDPK
ncbi:conserved hypothetical protein [Ricinus communis]|uniref:Uncharacterized protein n=1 Tax=Ricinus communis TaxID=3988 RepID=B9S332_RICCO|nr:conserved hypothetical protein [Ricinus communis]